MAAALEPLREKFPRGVVEREILRVVATIPAADDDLLPRAREQVIKWARNRSAGIIPAEAWEGEPFETLIAGRTTMATKVASGDSLLWSLRGDDPDKEVAGRIWSTEVSLGRAAEGEDIRLGVRLLVNSSEPELVIEPAVPGLIRQIADKCGLRDGPIPIKIGAHYASQEEHISTLIEWLSSNARRLPIIVATGDEREDNPNFPMLNVDALASAMCGLAHVVSIPASLTYKLSDELGKELAVFHGGIRAYQPMFTLHDDPRDHRLVLGHAARRDPNAVAAELQRGIARQSLRRTRLGHDVLSFSAVRSAAMRAQKEAQAYSGADESVKLSTALEQIEALEQQLADLQGQTDQALLLSEEESARAEDAEKQLHSSWSRIEALEAALETSGSGQAVAENPCSWEEFIEWCDQSFSGRLSLASAARRGIRKAVFHDVSMAANGIQWLAGEARNRFIEGGGSLANIPVFDGITNAPCGADEYPFDFQGRRLSATWHLKNGGNTRQPERCLRIYYAFDEQTRQIVVSDLPAHRRTGAT